MKAAVSNKLEASYSSLIRKYSRLLDEKRKSCEDAYKLLKLEINENYEDNFEDFDYFRKYQYEEIDSVRDEFIRKYANKDILDLQKKQLDILSGKVKSELSVEQRLKDAYLLLKKLEKDFDDLDGCDFQMIFSNSSYSYDKFKPKMGVLS